MIFNVQKQMWWWYEKCNKNLINCAHDQQLQNNASVYENSRNKKLYKYKALSYIEELLYELLKTQISK